MTSHCPYCRQRIAEDENTCDRRECIEHAEYERDAADEKAREEWNQHVAKLRAIAAAAWLK